MLSEGVGYSWGFIVVAMYGGMTVSRQMITEINTKWEKSDRLTVTKLNTVKHFNKQDYKSKLMTEKYSLLSLNPQQLTPVQTAIQRMSEKHPDFEIEPVNTV